MATRRPIVLVSGVQSELPVGDNIDGALYQGQQIVAGSGLVGGGLFTTDPRVDVALAANPSGLYFTGDSKVGFDGSATNISVIASGVSSGANSIYRTLQSRTQDFVNVKDFGATGDGSTDDYSSLQNAIQAANGRTLIFPPGQYVCGTTLVINSSQKPLVIEGNSASISFTGTGACIDLVSSSGAQSVDRLTIKNIAISKAASNANTNLTGIDAVATSTGAITRLNLVDVRIAGFSTSGSVGLRLNRCFINNFSGCEFFENLTGVDLQGVANNCAFYNCRFNNNDADGILISGAAIGSLFSGCEIEANGTNGLSITGAALDTTLDTCYIEANATNNVILDSASINTRLHNCFFWQSGSSHSVYFKQGSRLFISGNFYSADPLETTFAIKTEAAANDLVTGQIYYSGFDSGTYGLSVDSSTAFASVSGGALSSSNVVRAGSATSTTTPRFSFIGDETTGLGRSASGELTFVSSGSTTARVNGTGVGVNTSASFPLDISGESHFFQGGTSSTSSATTLRATAAKEGGLGTVEKIYKNAFTTAVASGANRDIKTLTAREIAFIKVFYSWPGGSPNYKFGVYTFDGSTVSTTWIAQSNAGHVFTLSESAGDLNITQSVGVTMNMMIQLEYTDASNLD